MMKMKKQFLFVAIALLAFAACKSEKDANGNAPNDTTNQATPTQDALDRIYETKTVLDSITGEAFEVKRPVDPISTAISSNPVSIPDAVKPKPVNPAPVSPQQKRIVRVLTKDYWIVWALHKIGHKGLNHINQGAWFKFNPDGSYQYGQFEKTIGNGAWSWRYEGDKAILLLDSDKVGDDREWSFLLGSDEDVMVWVGTDRYHTTDTQCKLQNLIQPPRNRKEMGFEE